VNQGIHNSVQGHAFRLNIIVNSVFLYIETHFPAKQCISKCIGGGLVLLTIIVNTERIGAEVCRLNIVLTVYRGMLSS
jgi:hypothetical protein